MNSESLSVLGKKVEIVEASTMVSEAGVISVNTCFLICRVRYGCVYKYS